MDNPSKLDTIKKQRDEYKYMLIHVIDILEGNLPTLEQIVLEHTIDIEDPADFSIWILNDTLNKVRKLTGYHT
jgi:hypothetical protein